MNRHQRREAKKARRRKRITGVTRGKVRGPVTRGMRRAELMREGQDRLLAMSGEIGRQLSARGVRRHAKWRDEEREARERLLDRIKRRGEREEREAA